MLKIGFRDLMSALSFVTRHVASILKQLTYYLNQPAAVCVYVRACGRAGGWMLEKEKKVFCLFVSIKCILAVSGGGVRCVITSL